MANYIELGAKVLACSDGQMGDKPAEENKEIEKTSNTAKG